MRFLFVTNLCGTIPMAYRLVREGHFVCCCVDNELAKKVGDGMLMKEYSRNMRYLVGKIGPDVVITEHSGYRKTMEGLRTAGVRVLGGCSWAYTVNTTPQYQRQLLTFSGIDTTALEGIPVTVEGWFNGTTCLFPLVHLVSSRFMDGEVGPDVGFMGGVSKLIRTEDRLYECTLSKLSGVLRKTSYKGPVYVDVVVDGDSLCATGLFVGFRGDLLPIFLEGYREDLGEFLCSVVGGLAPHVAPAKKGLLGAVAVSVSPWPYPVSLNGRRREITGVTRDLLKHFHPIDVMSSGGGYLCSNYTGEIGQATAFGTEVREVRRRLYRTVHNLKIDDIQYRTDIASEEVTGKLITLVNWEWISDWRRYKERG